MAIIETRGIVLRSIKYNDRARIVDIYTENSGRMSFMQYLSGTKKRSTVLSLFQPLTILQLKWTGRATSSIQCLSQAAIATAYTMIPHDPYKSAMALFLSEFLYYAVKEEQPDEALFEYLVHSLCWLDTAKSSYANFHLVFLIRLSRFLGFYPNLSGMGDGAFFDMQSSCFVDYQPYHPYYVIPEEAVHIPELMRMNYETMHLFHFTRGERTRLLEIFNEYYRLHIPDFPRLKSLDVLKDVFSV